MEATIKAVTKKMGVWNLAVMACTLAMSLGILLVYARHFPPQVPLWYSRPWGEEQLTSPIWLLILPGLSELLGGLAMLICKKIIKDEVLKQIVLGTSMTIQVILSLGLLRITLLVN